MRGMNPILVTLIMGIAAWVPAGARADAQTPGRAPNPQAVEEVKSGVRTTANAAWWGFDAVDATERLQAALDSGAKSLLIPNMGEPWIVRPLTLRGDMEIMFEPGTLVLAKKDEFLGGGDSLFRATDVDNLVIRGYGATLRMRKKDYQNPPYKKAEWRMGISINGCKNVLIEGLRIESSGGDGVYIAGGSRFPWSEDVTVRNVVCDDHHRQGISVISAVNLLIENCLLANTLGTAPTAGIDLEPDGKDERLVNCVIRNCVMESNAGHGILVYMRQLTRESEPVSVRFENCLVRMGHTAGQTMEHFTDIDMEAGAGMVVGAAKDDGPKGLVEFINCSSENTGKEGAKVFDMAADGVRVRFVNCSWRTPWVSASRTYWGTRTPVRLELRRPELTTSAGNVEFVDCHVFDRVVRPVINYDEPNAGEYGIRNVSGRITLHGPAGAPATMKLGPKATDITLEVVSAVNDAEPLKRAPGADAE